MIETRRELANIWKYKKMASSKDLKFMDEEKCRAKLATEERKVQVEESRVTLEKNSLAKHNA